jgi:hypothetical protein
MTDLNSDHADRLKPSLLFQFDGRSPRLVST